MISELRSTANWKIISRDMCQQQKNQPAGAVHTGHHIIVGIGFSKEYEAELAAGQRVASTKESKTQKMQRNRRGIRGKGAQKKGQEVFPQAPR